MRGFALRLGAPIDLVRSCSGHVLLAFSRPDQTDRMLELAERSRSAPVERPKLEKTLAKVRERGFDMMASPITHGVTDMSYPVFGFHGDVMAALTIPFLELIDGSQKVPMDETRQRLQRTAQRISALLGHHAAR